MKALNRNAYKQPEFKEIVIDTDITLVMATTPAQGPGETGSQQQTDPDKNSEDKFKTNFD